MSYGEVILCYQRHVSATFQEDLTHCACASDVPMCSTPWQPTFIGCVSFPSTPVTPRPSDKN